MQSSGFFDAMEIVSGVYDREYAASQFAQYFSLFVGNGVFIEKDNALKVVSGGNMNIMLRTGVAFINGFWYINDTDYVYTVPLNSGSTSRVDSVVLRLDTVERTLEMAYKLGDTSVTRDDEIYELQLARITINAGALAITDAYIVDTRFDEKVCGVVKGLVEVVSTNELFNQFNAMFVEWFETIRGQLSGDIAGSLQLQINDLNGRINRDYYGTNGYAPIFDLMPNGNASADLSRLGACYISSDEQAETYHAPGGGYALAFGERVARYGILFIAGDNSVLVRTRGRTWSKVALDTELNTLRVNTQDFASYSLEKAIGLLLASFGSKTGTYSGRFKCNTTDWYTFHCYYFAPGGYQSGYVAELMGTAAYTFSGKPGADAVLKKLGEVNFTISIEAAGYGQTGGGVTSCSAKREYTYKNGEWIEGDLSQTNGSGNAMSIVTINKLSATVQFED